MIFYVPVSDIEEDDEEEEIRVWVGSLVLTIRISLWFFTVTEAGSFSLDETSTDWLDSPINCANANTSFVCGKVSTI